MEKTNGKLQNRIWGCIRLFLAAMCLFTGICPMQARAEGEKVKSALIKENNIYVYIQGISELPPEDLTVQVGNTVCEPERLSVMKPEDMETSVQTIILIDNSQSVSASYHAAIREILTGYIYGALENEKIKIGTISDTVSYLCEYTGNTEELGRIVENLSYQNQNTYLSDALYEVITGLNAENTGIFTKIIVIADGADDQTIGYTNLELDRLIEKSQYPVYMIGTKEKGNDSELETLFSFSRTASSPYFLLDEEMENSAVIAGLSEDRDYICICIEPEESLLDGSNKSILIKLNTENGEVQLKANVDMPFGNGSTERTKAVEKEQESVRQESEMEETVKSRLPVKENVRQEETDERSKVTAVWIAVVLMIAAVCTVICVAGRKRKKEKTQEGEQKESEKTVIMPQEDIERTMIMADDDSTEIMDMGTGGQINFIMEKYIRLRCTEQAERSYKAPVRDVVRIGRTEGDIRIGDDKKVSRRHCEIALCGGKLYLKDVGSSNGTYYQDRQIYEETLLLRGDIIKIGTWHYMVELIEE